jgi:hypothetical protein
VLDDVEAVAACVGDAYRHYIERIGKPPGPMLEDYAEVIRQQGFAAIYLYTHEKMTENQVLYTKIGYVEYDRRVEKGYSRVYMRKRLA